MPFPAALDSITDGITTILAAHVKSLQDITVGPVWFNVKAAAYGAKGDGVTNDRAAFAAAEAAAGAVKGSVQHPPGTYIITGNPIIPQNGVTHFAPKGSVLIKKTDAGDVYSNAASPGTLDSVSFIGLSFDMTLTGWSAIDLFGSDAGGQVTNLLIRDCNFKNPSIAWMVQINYTIADPAVPTLKNRNIRLEDCTDDAAGQTFTLENVIFINCQDVYVVGNRFVNATAVMAAHVACYGYCRNVRFLGNYVDQCLSARAVYCVQSDTISIIGDQFRTTANSIGIEIFNCLDIKVIDCQAVAGSSGQAFVNINDFSGTTFDGHTNLYGASSGISVQNNRVNTLNAVVLLNCGAVQGQTDIQISGNMAAIANNLFRVTGIPNAPTAPVTRISITGNHVISHSGVSGGSACVAINGNATAANGGLQDVLVADNFFNNPGAGGCDVEVFNKADRITIINNHSTTGALVPHVIAAAATNVVCVNNVRALETPTSGTLGANVTSVTATGSNYRGTMAIVMAGALAANTRIATITFLHSPFGATVPKIRLINQTSGAGLANVNFYVLATGTGQTFDIASNQALALGTYTVAYDIVPAGLN